MKHPQNKSTENNSSAKSTLESLSEAYRKLGPYLNIGYVFVIFIVGFTLLGWYLDRHWNTGPWLMVTGAVIGIGSGFYYFFKTVMSANDE